MSISDPFTDYDIEILAEHSTDPTAKKLAIEVRQWRSLYVEIDELTAMIRDMEPPRGSKEPNPYATRVEVRAGLNGVWWAHVAVDGTSTDPIDGNAYPTHIWLKFTHPADAHRHAALILAALHQAVIE